MDGFFDKKYWTYLFLLIGIAIIVFDQKEFTTGGLFLMGSVILYNLPPKKE